MNNSNLKIITLIHDITQLGYNVRFCNDFTNMLRLEFTEEYNPEFYDHDHLSIPDGGLDRLEKEVIATLMGFYEQHKEEA